MSTTVPRGDGSGLLRRTIWLLAAALLALPGAGLGQEDVAVVVLQKGQSLRDVAAEHLGDPDLWDAILRFNDLESVTDASTGSIALAMSSSGASRVFG